MNKAFAVAPGRPVPRSTAYTPRSAGWTLYRAGDVAKQLGVDEAAADAALETTGFNKAVRIREEIIRWKERLRGEERELQTRRSYLRDELAETNSRLKVVQEQLENVRNILRLPREKPEAK